MVIILALIVPNSGLFQADLQSIISSTPGTATTNCQQIQTLVLPQNPLPANTAGIIAITTTPENFAGPFTYSASSGNLDDSAGNSGSYIKTSAKKVSYTGGDDGTNITIQASGDQNIGCVATVPVIKASTVACQSLKVTTNPSPLPPNQSAEITLTPTPSNFNGTYLIQADSGVFQIQQADVQANGNNTKTLVTKSTNVLYNGGKNGEKIVVRTLGQNNDSCNATISIIK